jgi:Protein of unknown function (DUF3558)
MTFRLPLVAFAVMLCAACSSTVIGDPTARPPDVQLPPRPRELRINGLDPCTTLTSGQLQSLGVRFYSADPPRGNLGPSCDWNHSPNEPIESYTVDVNTRGGVELAFEQPQLTVITVAGFGAVTTPGRYSSGERECIINVDVAPGQAVQIGYFYNGTSVPMNHEIACQKARNAAELAMQTIQAKIGG